MSADIAEELSTHNVVLEAYPGWGKTRLAAALASQFKRALIVERTVEEIVEVLKMAKERVIPVYGKEKVCPLWKKGNDYDVYAFCERMRLLGRCPYKYKADGKFVRWLAAFPRYPSQIVERAKKSGICPYPSVLALAKSPRVVTTYAFYFTRPDIADGRDIIVFDESHELLSALMEMTTYVNDIYVNNLVSSLKESLDTRPLAYFIKRCWQKSNDGKAFFECIERAPASSGIIDTLVNAYYSKRCYASGKDVWCLVAKPNFSDHGNLFLSAYLPPFLLDAIPNVKVVRVEPPQGAVQAIIDDELTSKYEERGEEVYRGYAEKIAQYYDRGAANLVIFPSHVFMKEVTKYLPQDISSRVRPAEAVREAKEGDLVFDVARGRAAEGVNPSESLRRVIVVGLPYPPPNGPLNLLANIYGFEATYMYLALLAVVQAIGRLRLRPGTTAVLMDRRYRDVVRYLPSYIVVENGATVAPERQLKQ